MQKRYSRSRPASISISGLLPSNQPPNQQSSPSSSTITSTTITSPHDSVTPITFTVTTTYLDQLQQQLQQQQQIQQQQQEQQQQQHQHNLERRKAKLTAEDLQYQQFIEENQFLKNQYAQQPQQINQQPLQLQQQQQQLQVPNDNSSNGSNSNTNINKYYRRSVAFGTANSNSNSINSNNNLVSDVASESGLQSPNMLNNSNGMMINNSITKANIQQLKEKIDRYSKEKMRELRESTQSMSMRRGDMGATLSNLNPQAAVGSSTTQTSTTSTNTSGAIEKDKERDKLLRYSVDFERFKERHQKEMAEKRCSRDISREIERELEKRLSPRERISMLLSNNNNNNNNNIGGSLSGQSNRIGDRESRSFRYSVSSQNQYNLSNIMNNGGGKTYGNSSRDSGNYNRYSKDYRYSRELDNEELDFLSRQQRSQSCFDDNIPRNGSSTSINNNYENTQYQSILLEQKLDKLKETMNNIRTQRDDRTSRDYTLYIRDMDELRASLAKETETSEFFATKSLELVEKLRKEEEKNQKLMEEIQLMESYFALKEKLKRSKRHSISTKEILTRSRSPTLPTNITSTSTTTTTNTSNNNISGSPKEHISLSTSSSSISTSSSNSSTSNNAQLNKDQMMNQLLRGGNSSRKLK
ncbi:RhoGAP domain-containing protein [Heterostelium album PN500]|uniref:RhoGAP domain-containing protein n=1 Tax=Heterostelium pallidum (strain ATCC 26659 / Pp 5 / PN500) TaxID=670386 RepID=D3BAD7_HETP5|nr:RhoGAP domain-containing protein [Heterostelium album PN500]EFA81524.1 RhoGAP domain-containing protein [Heterostelium album PN500]|eukprot:XP_020433641.1 RhoGAP domain-containing protein [Heterostelium album PN500]